MTTEELLILADEWKPYRDELQQMMHHFESGDVTSAILVAPKDVPLWDATLAILIPESGATSPFSECHKALASDAETIDVVYKLLVVGEFV